MGAKEHNDFVDAVEALLPKKTVPDYGPAVRLGLSRAAHDWSPEQRAKFLDKLKAATRVKRPREKLPTAMTGAERAKRARLKKKGERLPEPPRAMAFGDVLMLHAMNSSVKKMSLRTLYRRRRVAHGLVSDPNLLSLIANVWKAYDGNEQMMERTLNEQLIEGLTIPELIAFEKLLPELPASDVPECDAFVRQVVTTDCDGYRESGLAKKVP